MPVEEIGVCPDDTALVDVAKNLEVALSSACDAGDTLSGKTVEVTCLEENSALDGVEVPDPAVPDYGVEAAAAAASVAATTFRTKWERIVAGQIRPRESQGESAPQKDASSKKEESHAAASMVVSASVARDLYEASTRLCTTVRAALPRKDAASTCGGVCTNYQTDHVCATGGSSGKAAAAEIVAAALFPLRALLQPGQHFGPAAAEEPGVAEQQAHPGLIPEQALAVTSVCHTLDGSQAPKNKADDSPSGEKQNDQPQQAQGTLGPGLDDTHHSSRAVFVLDLCHTVLDTVAFWGTLNVGAGEAAELALEALRRHIGNKMPHPQVAPSAASVFRSLGDIVKTGALANDTVRRVIAYASDVIGRSLRFGLELHSAPFASAAIDAVVLAIAATPTSRIDSFEIMLDTMLKHGRSLAGPSTATVVRLLVDIVLQCLLAVCAPRPLVPPAEWMTAAYTDARHCARVAAINLVKFASQGSSEAKVLFEKLVVEVAEAAANPARLAAPLALRAFIGSLIAVLRSRGVGEMKVLAMRILGVATARFSLACALDEAAMCKECHANLRVRDTKIRRTDLHPEFCDQCLLHLAALDLSQKEGFGEISAASPWCGRHLLLKSMVVLSDSAAAMPGLGVRRGATRRSAHRTLYNCSFLGCEWSASSEEGDNRDGDAHAARYLAEVWPKFLAGRAACDDSDVSGVSWHALTARLLRPQSLELYKDANRLQSRVVRAALQQLESPRAWLRAAALRALVSIVRASKRYSSRPQLIPRSTLVAAASRDSSAQVRAAAVQLIGQLTVDNAQTKSLDPPADLDKETSKDSTSATRAWALAVVRAVNAADPSLAVQTTANRLLGAYVRRHPLDKLAFAVCCELVARLVDPVAGLRTSVLEDIHAYLYAGESGLRATELLQLLATAHRHGVRGMVTALLRCNRKAASSRDQTYCSAADTRDMAAALVCAFASDPQPSRIAGLLAFSEAMPWALADHARSIATYLAISAPPSPSDEVIALGACNVLADVLGTLGTAAVQALTPWAWARIDVLVTSHGSRLARPAMRCLCVAANAEGDARMILGHLRKAASILRAEAEFPEGTVALTRAAWIAATACEYCDLDNMIGLDELGLRPNSIGERSAGRAIASDLLQIYCVLSSVEHSCVSPALILALGFALRRHTWLVALKSTNAALSYSLQVSFGKELLVERTLEAYAQLLDSLTNQSEKQGSSEIAQRTAGPRPDEVASSLSRYQTTLLSLLRYGLHRRAEVTDGPLRARALSAVRALHRSGQGHPVAVASVLFPLVFADRSLRRGAAALLSSVAKRNPEAVAGALTDGVLDAFGAMLWQTPHQLTTAGAFSLERAIGEVSQAYSVSPRGARVRWVRALLGELQGVRGDFSFAKLPAVPADPNASVGRLTPFGKKTLRGSPGGRSDASVGGPSSGGCTEQLSSWPQPRRIVLQYCQFIGTMLSALPLSEAEAEVLENSCSRYLELRPAAIVSANEHGASAMPTEDVFAVCVSTAFCIALKRAMKAPGGAARVGAMRTSVEQQLVGLAPAAQRGTPDMAEWLACSTEDHAASLARRKRRRVCTDVSKNCTSNAAKAAAPFAVRKRGRPPKNSSQQDLTPPKKQKRQISEALK